MISLDSLLSESLTASKEALEAKAARVILSKGGLPAADRAAVSQSLRDFEARREWLPQAYVAMFNRQRCSCCNSFQTQFAGFFQRQKHRTSNFNERWIPFMKPVDDNLPREAKYNDSVAELCEDCAEHLGFDVEGQ